jgi:hypothetical protein
VHEIEMFVHVCKAEIKCMYVVFCISMAWLFMCVSVCITKKKINRMHNFVINRIFFVMRAHRTEEVIKSKTFFIFFFLRQVFC